MKILLLCEAPMCINAGGIAQTLYNIFSFCSEGDILCISPKNELKTYPPTSPFNDSYISYTFEIVKPLRNRIGHAINKYIEWINFSINQKRSFKTLKKKIYLFKPDIIVSCPNSSIGVFMHEKLLKNVNVKILPYFMDDWMYKSKLKWLGGDLNQLVYKMLSKNKRWMMISEELGVLLQDRYQVIADEIFVVHNPINLENAPNTGILRKQAKYTFAYAGALWPMHFDAFVSIARALSIVDKTIPNVLNLYTAETFWSWRKEDLKDCPVVYGGSIAYENIHHVLNKADVLIVTSSFLPDYYTHTKASVQTKITDYLKSRKLIISIGPSYSANNNFLEKHQCGLCIETDDPYKMSEQIKYILEHIDSYQWLVDNGWAHLNEHFTFDKVHSNFNFFLNN